MNTIRSIDMFGHVVNLNFDERGISHKTFIGGFFSIFIRIFLTIYFYLNIQKIIFSKGDKNVSTVGLLNLIELGPVNLNSTKLKIFHVVRKQKKDGSQLTFEDGELEQYLDIKWETKKSDWYTMQFEEKTYNTKLCELSDFGEGDSVKKLFDAWAGFTLICPTKEAVDNTQL